MKTSILSYPALLKKTGIIKIILVSRFVVVMPSLKIVR